MVVKISVVINTLNEEKNIADCICSVSNLADEIVVCDMYSDDNTVEIAGGLGAKIVYHERTGFVEPARYFAIGQAIYEWILVIDADERMTEKLAHKLREIVHQDSVDVVLFWSLYWYFGGWVRNGGFFCGEWPRFFRKQVYLENFREDEKLVHHNFNALKEHSNKLRLSSEYYMIHFAYPDIEKYICKTVAMYARLESEQRFSRGEAFSGWRMIVEPIKEFFNRFIALRGFRDGWRGFVLAVFYSTYRFSVWANLWFLGSYHYQNEDQILRERIG